MFQSRPGGNRSKRAARRPAGTGVAFVTACLVASLFSAIPVQPVRADVAGTALQFDGANDYVTFGPATSTLGATQFTLEAWVKRAAGGTTMSTGSLGLDGTGGRPKAYPVLTKGMGEGETPANVNMNWFLGITDTGFIGADFEDTAGGVNHPVWGTQTVSIGEWHHIAATYDGQTWKLYFDGALDKSLTLASPYTPESTSIQHAALATGLNSTGGTSTGFFAGIIDEARVWNVVRTQPEIAGAMRQELTSGTGLRGRWGLNDGNGTTAVNSIGGSPSGTLTNGPTWAPGFPDNVPPATPTGFSATGADGRVNLTWTANSDSDLAGYKLYRSTASPVPTTGTPLNGPTLIAKTATTYTDATGVVGTPYFYALVAADTSGNDSSPSAEASGTPLADLTPPVAPTDLAGSPHSNRVDLTWTANGEPDLAGYNVYRSLTSGVTKAGSPINGSLVTGASYSDATAVNGTPYFYAISAVDASANESGLSGEITVTPEPGNEALDLGSGSGYVTFGDPAKLDLDQFTIETWFKRTGTGTSNTTGSRRDHDRPPGDARRARG